MWRNTVLKFHRGERFYQTKRIKNNRKSYWGYHRVYGTRGKQTMDSKQLGRVSQYPSICSRHKCSGSTYRKMHGNGLNGLTVQSLRMLDYCKSFSVLELHEHHD